ncbi:MAG: hypothetical protein NC120_09925 [Ruminococcus sp.]|nr:hypothetical protein [Ruminococcus sp.]
MNKRKILSPVLSAAIALTAAATPAAYAANNSAPSGFGSFDMRAKSAEASENSKVTVVADYGKNPINTYGISTAVEADLISNGKSYITFGIDNTLITENKDSGMTDFTITATPVDKSDTWSAASNPVTVSWTCESANFTENLEIGGNAFKMPVSVNGGIGTFPISDFELYSVGTTNEIDENGNKVTVGYSESQGIYEFGSVTARMTYEIPAVINEGGEKKIIGAEEFVEYGMSMVKSDHMIAADATQIYVSSFIAGTAAGGPKVPAGTSGSSSVYIEDSEIPASAVFNDEELKQIEDGAEAGVTLVVNDNALDIPAADRSAVQAAAEKDGYSIGLYLDLTLFKTIDEEEEAVKETYEEISIVANIPANFIKDNRIFVVIRVHGGTTDILEDKDSNPNTVTFSTDKFSTYAIAYKDVSAAGGDGQPTPIPPAPTGPTGTTGGSGTVVPAAVNTVTRSNTDSETAEDISAGVESYAESGANASSDTVFIIAAVLAAAAALLTVRRIFGTVKAAFKKQ